MQQLTGLDTTFLNIETPTTYGHVSGLAIFDPSTSPIPATADDTRALITERIHLLPPYRRRLVEVPFGLDHPYWIEDPDFDLEYHVRHIGLPAPGDDRQLASQVERIIARPLDRSRPLWELYLIEGLENGCVAQLTKIHHSAIDGVSGAEILANLLDLEPTPRVVDPPDEPWTPDRVPSQMEMLQRGLRAVATKPAKGVRLTIDAINNLPALAKTMGIDLPDTNRLRPFRGREPEPMLSEASTRPPRTSFNALIGPHRRFAYGSIPLADLKTAKNAFGVTLNDVVLAMCSSALRQYLVARDELPDDPLIAMVPVSVRTEQQSGEFGNRVANMTTSLHTDIADPVERLRGIHESMSIAKDTHHALPATLLQDIAEFPPPAVAARAARLAARASARRLVDLPYNVVISNVPGPQFPLYGIGAQLVANYPVSTITDGVGLNITVQSYNGNLDVGLVGCRDLVPDIWDILDHVRAALDELNAIASAPAAKSSARKRQSAATTAAAGRSAS